MLISVIVPFLNAARHLPRFLEALAGVCYPDSEFILVDNNSRDGSPDIVRAFIKNNPGLPITLLHEKKPGSTAARNLGAAAARGEWLAFTDADCIVSPAWLSDLASAIDADPGPGAFAGCIRPADSGNIVTRFLGLYTLPPNSRARVCHQYTLVDGGFPTANLTVRADVFNQTGGFDESIRIYGEDHDLCMRIYKAGFCVKCLTNAVVQHVHRSTLAGLLRQAFNFGTVHAIMASRFDSGFILVQVPFIDFRRWKGRCKIWLDLNLADKKMLGTIVAGFIWPPLFLLSFAYVAYLSLSIYRRGARMHIPVKIMEAPVLAGLLLLKSAAMTAGRIAGSLRYKVICI
ncbi:MAG: glycosyltransferase [Kiritimatiellia bacterium]